MKLPSDNDDLIPLLEQRVIPWWKRYGMQRLAISAETLKEFRAQPLPEQMRTTVKKRRAGQKVLRRQRRHGTSVIESWPEDNQRTLRYPVLVCSLQGQADFHIADYIVHCPEGNFLLFRPGVPQPEGSHSHLLGNNREQSYCEVLWFVVHPGTNCVTAQVCCSQGDRHWARHSLGFCLVPRREVIGFFEAFMRELVETPPDETRDRETSNAIFQAFLLLYLRELKAGRFHRAGKKDAEVKDEAETSIAQARAYINSHLSAHLTTESVAKTVFMSRTHFMRSFQQETGQTFHDYLTVQRMDEACRLLREGSWSQSTICRWVGLSPSRLRALFHERFGVSPTQFQRLNGKNEAK